MGAAAAAGGGADCTYALIAAVTFSFCPGGQSSFLGVMVLAAPSLALAAAAPSFARLFPFFAD